jgi:hypothetical protein
MAAECLLLRKVRPNIVILVHLTGALEISYAHLVWILEIGSCYYLPLPPLFVNA